MATSKRFIAGAVCPSCKLMDKTVIVTKDEQKVRECISCGFSDVAPQQSFTSEPVTRVTQQQSQPAQPIKFVP